MWLPHLVFKGREREESRTEQNRIKHIQLIFIYDKYIDLYMREYEKMVYANQ
jgi:hypothetical protein